MSRRGSGGSTKSSPSELDQYEKHAFPFSSASYSTRTHPDDARLLQLSYRASELRILHVLHQNFRIFLCLLQDLLPIKQTMSMCFVGKKRRLTVQDPAII